MRNAVFILIILHGFIHMVAFARAYDMIWVNTWKRLSRTQGVFWLITGIVFWVSGELMFLKVEYWWLLMIVGIILSQYLMTRNWREAKPGTFLNILFAGIAIAGMAEWSFRSQFDKAVKSGFHNQKIEDEQLLKQADIEQLPQPVIKYLHYTEVVGKPKVRNFRVRFSGHIRKDKHSEWMPLTSVQYNFMNTSTRLFYMNATMFKMPVKGFHSYRNGDAFMDIRLFSMLNVQYRSGKEMGIAETVTFFNDMCCMAPATLIDERIKWTPIDEHKVKAEFTSSNISISAFLLFNDKGELVNFISDDRFAETDSGMFRYRWSTPLKDYKWYNGVRLASHAEAIYSYPHEDLVYASFALKDVAYNCKNSE